MQHFAQLTRLVLRLSYLCSQAIAAFPQMAVEQK